MPELLKQGKVYVAETPLFEIVLGGKDGSVFAYTVEEKNQILADLEKKGKKFKKIHRSKGLGENTPDMLWDTTMNPETRLLRQVTIENAAEADHIFSMLMGDEVAPRREFIEENASYANIDA